jgi:uncharacterized membrane protein
VGELRAALPIAITVLDLHPITAYLITVAGNLIPVAIIWWIFPIIVQYAEDHSPRLKHIINDHLHKLSNKHKERFQKYGSLALFFFVAIPFPGSGVWTGSLLAILFNIERKLAIRAIIGGVLFAGIIVLIITQGTLLALV